MSIFVVEYASRIKHLEAENARLTAENERMLKALQETRDLQPRICDGLDTASVTITRLTAEVERLKLELNDTITELEWQKGRADSLGEGCQQFKTENERLRAALQAWDDAVRIDVLMEGPRYMGVDLRRGRDAWEKTKSALRERCT